MNVAILNDLSYPVQNVVQVPARIEKLISEKQYYAAVQFHVQSMLMLEREGLQTVGLSTLSFSNHITEIFFLLLLWLH